MGKKVGSGAEKVDEFLQAGREDPLESFAARRAEPAPGDVGNFLSALRGRGQDRSSPKTARRDHGDGSRRAEALPASDYSQGPQEEDAIFSDGGETFPGARPAEGAITRRSWQGEGQPGRTETAVPLPGGKGRSPREGEVIFSSPGRREVSPDARPVEGAVPRQPLRGEGSPRQTETAVPLPGGKGRSPREGEVIFSGPGRREVSPDARPTETSIARQPWQEGGRPGRLGAVAPRAGEEGQRGREEEAVLPGRGEMLAHAPQTGEPEREVLADWMGSSGSDGARQRPVQVPTDATVSPLEGIRPVGDGGEGLWLGVRRARRRDDTRSAEEAAAAGRPAFVPYHVEAPAPVAPPQAARDMVQLARDMVREILVNDAAFNGKSEIHMQLKGSIFAGTQVQIIRDGDTLSVVFHTANGQSADLIRQNQEVLRNALLEERFQLSEVQIRTQGADADHGQGRSRGQRDAGEEWQMAEEGDE